MWCIQRFLVVTLLVIGIHEVDVTLRRLGWKSRASRTKRRKVIVPEQSRGFFGDVNGKAAILTITWRLRRSKTSYMLKFNNNNKLIK